MVIAQRATGALIRRIDPPEADPAADPCVLFVRGSALELDQHPEPPRVEVADPEYGAQRVDRSVADERGRMLRPRPAHAIAADDANLTTEEVREWPRPTALDDVPGSGPTVDVGLDGAVEARLRPRRPCRPGTSGAASWHRGSVQDPTWTISPDVNWSTRRPPASMT